jgi:hypothetical protein
VTSRTRRAPISVTLPAALLVVIALGACTAEESRTFQLETLNDSGVTGMAVMTDLRDGSTRVVIDVDPAGHLDMPAHIHPGTCVDLVPQPLYPLQSVIDGDSETVVSRSLSELLVGDLALNLHVSSDDMGTYAACVDLN